MLIIGMDLAGSLGQLATLRIGLWILQLGVGIAMAI